MELILNLKHSEGINWLEHNPYIIINIFIKTFDNNYLIRVKRHLITNQYYIDRDEKYNKFEHWIKMATKQNEIEYNKFFEKFYKILDEIYEEIFTANSNCWKNRHIEI